MTLAALSNDDIPVAFELGADCLIIAIAVMAERRAGQATNSSSLSSHSR
jgi:hypothetical protein